MQILLAGGGNTKQSEAIDKKFINIIKKDAKILYIPIAMGGRYEECLKWFKSVYKDLYDINNIEMLIDLKNANEKKLLQFDCIFIGGGNTFFLLSEIKKHGFDLLLKKFLLDNSKLIYGGSAGAIIFGKDIIQASIMDKNEIGLTDTRGLDLLDGNSIICHYEEYMEGDIRSFEDDIGKIIRMKEEDGLYVNNGEYEKINIQNLSKHRLTK